MPHQSLVVGRASLVVTDRFFLITRESVASAELPTLIPSA